jgi:hypothetical protein
MRAGVRRPTGSRNINKASYDTKTAFTDAFIADINKFDQQAIRDKAKKWKDE